MNTPNILFLFTDDQRFDTIRALGNAQIYTPNFDYIARNGTAFTNAYIMGGSCGAVCMPSRAMMLTGRTLYHIEKEGQSIPEEHKLLPEYFRKAGYSTFGIGKWHNGPAAYTRSFTYGAEIFFGGMDDHWNVPACNFSPDGDYPPPRLHPVPRIPGEWEKIPKRFDHIQRGYHSTDLFADATRDFLLEHDTKKPFLAYISFMAPHDPRTMPQQFLNMYDDEKIQLPKNYLPEHPFDNGALVTRDERLEAWPRTEKRIKQHIAEYYAMITHLDSAIGRILDALKATGQFENTIILLAGDNGLALGQHGLMGKQNLYDHSLHVPLLMMGPGIPKGVRNDALCYLLDIFPTLCDFCELPIPKTVEGNSLFQTLAHPQQVNRKVLHFAFKEVQRGVRDSQFKLIEYVVDKKRHTQLFDLKADPLEKNNLAQTAKYNSVLNRLKQELSNWRIELGDDTEQGQLFWKNY